jgi:hypothetical protein
MFTETILGVMLANLLGVTAALPFIAAQRLLAGDGKRSQTSRLEDGQALPPPQPARRRGRDRSGPHTPASAPPRRQAGQKRVVGSC